MKALKHHKYPYNMIVSDLREKFEGITDLYDITLSYQNGKLNKDDDLYNEGRWHFCGHQRESLAIHVNDRENNGSLVLDYDYLVDIFRDREIEFIHDHMIRILWHALDNPQKAVGKLEMVSEREKRRILYEFNDTACDYPADKNIIRLFEEQAEKTPHRPAVFYADKSMTYDVFNRRVNRLAWKLIEAGARPGDVIAVLIPRNIHALVSIYAVLKCGAVFLPIDPMYPKERIGYMLDDARPRIILYDDESVRENAGCGSTWINAAEPAGNRDQNPEIYPCGDCLAYIIYTSGSTGNPKGAMITHKGLVNYIVWADKVYVRGDEMAFALHSSLSFDLTITSIFTPLISGNSIVIYEEDSSEPLILRVFMENRSDIVKLTPSHLSLIKDMDNSGSRVKRLIVGGEDLRTELARQVHDSFGGNVEIYNEYGPTETVVGCMIYKYDRSRDNRVSVPIGKPADNVRLYILDRHLNPVPIGTPGELCIGGDGVCAGYLNNPVLTAKKFIQDPFLPDERIYMTGDLARWFPRGDVEYLGRIDDQVKIRGYRVEPGEIETQLLSHSGVSSAVVLVYDDMNGRKSLCAYVKADAGIDENDLRIHLAKRLPAWMVPSCFVFVDEIPLTPNGKVDKHRLPKPESKARQQEYAAPSDETERILADAVQEVSGLEKAGVYDSFDDLGIDSLDILKIQAKLLKYGWKLTTQDFYEYPNIRLLSQKVKSRSESSSGPETESRAETEKFSPVFFGNAAYEGSVLLTGATGFLGAHLLHEIISGSSAEVYCLVRGDDSEDAEKRLQSKLDWYFGSDFRRSARDRIHVIRGDFTLRNFGLSDDEYRHLGGKVRRIIHSGALVKHYGDTHLFERTNCYGTEQAADFAEAFGLRLDHISTVSVAGIFDGPGKKAGEFFENDIYMGQHPEDNVYIKTKVMSERMIVNRISNNRLNAGIFRIGNLTGRYSDGVFQQNRDENLFYKRICSIIRFGSVPANILDTEVDLTPVDLCSNAVIKIIKEHSDRADIYHVYNNNKLKIAQLAELLSNIGKRADIVDPGSYARRVKELYENNVESDLVYSFINELDEGLSIRDTVKLNCARTLEILGRLGFTWPVCDEGYISRLYGDIG
jgi:amino acid adenylation domain-containing protein/thioester reductase-like protein